MTRRVGKRLSRRHLVVVFLLFGGVGVLVVLANLRQPLNMIVDEPAEVTNKRTDTENNAYYVLAEAAKLLPESPPDLKLKDEQGWDYYYTPEDDSLGQMLNIRRPDDDPVLIEYMDKCLPALNAIPPAFDKPWFLYPPHSFDSTSQRELREDQDRLFRLVELSLAQARIRPCSEDPNQDACAHLHNAMRLSCLLGTDGVKRSHSQVEAVEVIRKASADHQHKIAAWLGQLRAGWKPPLTAIDRDIRRVYATSLGPLADKEIWPVRVFWKARIAQLKKALYRQEAYIRKTSCMTQRQYEDDLREHPKFRETYLSGELFSQFRVCNSEFFGTADGLSIVVALELFRRDRGGYPQSLSDLVPQYLPQLPENPFCARPFAYATEGGDYVLYCVSYEPPDRPPHHFLLYAPKDRRDNFWMPSRPEAGA
ncbi:MAG: hypothetical protein NTZ09_11065 [Candidatus Hydrogenedentes bacterium]|nr:hypothetical protein [Candidatus Hydrogenedentota bacterium]